MTNGQLNMVSVPTVTQLVTQEPTVPVAGAEQNGDFAGMLSGIQRVAKGKDLPDSGQADQSQVKMGKDQLILNAATEGQAVDLLARLNVSPDIAVSVPAAPKQKEPEKVESSNDAVPTGSEQPDVASQMAMAAYLQTGRMPEVNIPTVIPLDALQNVASVTAQPAIVSASAVTVQPVHTAAGQIQAQPVSAKESMPASLPQPATPGGMPAHAIDAQNVTVVPAQSAAEPMQTAQVITPVQQGAAKEPASASSSQPVASDRMFEVNKPASLPAGKQNVTTVPAQPAAEPMQTAQVIMPVPQGAAKESAPASSPQPAASDRMSEVNKPTSLPVDVPQNVASAIQQSAVISAPAVTIQPEQPVAEPIQVPQVIMPTQPVSAKEPSPATSPQPAVSDRMSEAGKPTSLSVDKLQDVAVVTDQPVLFAASSEKTPAEKTTTEPVQTTPAEKLITAAIPVRPERSSVHPASTPDASPESAVEIQLSQPQPITARVTASAVMTDNRSTEVVSEPRGGKQRFATDQQVETIRTGNETSAVKEMASLLKSAVSSGGSLADPGTPRGDNGDQGNSDNQTLAQQMSVQTGAEHQKMAALSTKTVTNEPVRQDVSEQVMQQVKERLVQHDVKPGNQQITLTLSPDNLGELKMNLNLQGQKLSVEIVTDNRTVRDAIVQHTDALKESLARQNITMSSFDVTTGGKDSGNQGQNQNAWRELAQQQQQQKSWALPRGYNIAQADLPSGQAAYQRQQGQTMLDIHY